MCQQNNDTCAICYEPINTENPNTTQLQCVHNNIFHNTCMALWIENKYRPRCPYCGIKIILSEEQLQRQQNLIRHEDRYVPIVYDPETEFLMEQARQAERDRIQLAIERRVMEIRQRQRAV